MFFGNMQSFYRRNSIRKSTSSQSSKQTKDQISRKQVNKSRRDDNDDCRSKNHQRNSFSISTDNEGEQQVNEVERNNVPIIRIGMYEPETSKKSFNILKEKEKALWFNNSPDLDDGSERLGPNKNNIIEETLGCERRKSEDWGNTHLGGITSAGAQFL